MKKTLKVMAVILLATVLVGCDGEATNRDVNNSTDIVIQQTEKVVSKVTEVKVNDKSFEVEATYDIQSHTGGWVFTAPSKVNIALTADAPEGYEVMITSVYSDIAIISNNSRYDGLRQDSMFLEYGTLDRDGIDVDSVNTYDMTFNIEGINQNEVFLHILNGTGYAGTKRTSNKEMAQHASGSQLNVTWTLLVRDTATGKTYMKSIDDNVGIEIFSGE